MNRSSHLGNSYGGEDKNTPDVRMPHPAGPYKTLDSSEDSWFFNMHLTLFVSPLVMVNYSTSILSCLLRKQAENTCHTTEIAHAGSDNDNVKSCSGPARTHDALSKMAPVKVGPRVAHTEQFTCKGGVDARRLVDLSRKGLYSVAKMMGGNVLLEEQWDCIIRHARLQKRDEFKVVVRYSATVARSTCPDVQKPVQIESAKGIKGLMTVLDRHAEIC